MVQVRAKKKAPAKAKAAPKKKAPAKAKKKAPAKTAADGLGPQIDALRRLREARLKADAKAKKAKEAEDEAAEALRERMQSLGVSSAKSKKASVAVVQLDSFSIEDADAFFGYIKKKNAFDLVQRRVATQALRDRLADGEKIPGLSKFSRFTVRLTAARK